jgi:hypothetical protein
VAGKGVLEIEQPEVGAVRQHHQIVDMIVAKHHDRILIGNPQHVAPHAPPRG